MIKHWLVTGDTHRRVIERINDIDTTKYTPRETALIILGDAGINFYLNKTDEKLKEAIQETGYTIYCVRGNHEERPENVPGIYFTPDDNVNGAVWYDLNYPNIRYFMDGSVYEINGKSVLVIGGAYSVDKWYRLNRVGIYDKFHPNYTRSKMTGWFPSEQLTTQEMETIEKQHFGKRYDVILTHTCPISWEPTDLFISGLDQSSVDKTMELWLDEVKLNIGWDVWLFAHFHADRIERPGVEMYYRYIEDWNTIMKRWERSELDWWIPKSPNYYMGR